MMSELQAEALVNAADFAETRAARFVAGNFDQTADLEAAEAREKLINMKEQFLAQERIIEEKRARLADLSDDDLEKAQDDLIKAEQDNLKARENIANQRIDLEKKITAEPY